MTTVKIKFRPSTSKTNIGKIYMQIIHNREVGTIKTDIKISEQEWSAKKIPKEVQEIEQNIKSAILYLEHMQRSFRVSDIITAYHSHYERGLFGFMEHIIRHQEQIGKQRTAETYLSTLRSLQRFNNNTDIELHLINREYISRYEAYLVKTGVKPNTIAFYMRIFRATYNRAVERELTPNRMPFKQVQTHTEKTIKRAISAEDLKRIKEVDLRHLQSIEFARDMFMLSFYTRGMSFVDMAYLRKKDVENGILSYRRRKTNQPLYIRWEECMQRIVDKYSRNTYKTPYLLPIIKSTSRDENNQYKVAIHTVNYNLKRLSKLLDIPTITTYVARHTWASVAMSKNIPISVISEGMGHESEKTTQIYLASLDNRIIDNANFAIISDF